MECVSNALDPLAVDQGLEADYPADRTAVDELGQLAEKAI